MLAIVALQACGQKSALFLPEESAVGSEKTQENK